MSKLSHSFNYLSYFIAELEDILVQYLSVRNKTRRRSGLPPSCPTFIKEKANMFYRDMYGDCPSEAGKDFKCSSGKINMNGL